MIFKASQHSKIKKEWLGGALKSWQKMLDDICLDFFFFAIAIILFAYWEGKINKTTLFLDWKLSLKLICCKKQTK